MDWQTWVWYYLLADNGNSSEYDADFFDYVLGFDDTPTAPKGREVNRGTSIEGTAMPQNLEAAWTLKWKQDTNKQNAVIGHFLLYRLDSTSLIRKKDPKAAAQAIGDTVKVLVVPVKVETRNQEIRWTDRYPNENDNKVTSAEAYLIVQDDFTYDVYGYEGERPSYLNKFFGVMSKMQRSQSKGLFTQRSSAAIESYRVWLEKVDDAAYKKHSEMVDTLQKEMNDAGTADERISIASKSSLLLVQVKDLLKLRKQAIVYHLLNPHLDSSVKKTDDFLDPAKVKNLRWEDLDPQYASCDV